MNTSLLSVEEYNRLSKNLKSFIKDYSLVSFGVAIISFENMEDIDINLNFFDDEKIKFVESCKILEFELGNRFEQFFEICVNDIKLKDYIKTMLYSNVFITKSILKIDAHSYNTFINEHQYTSKLDSLNDFAKFIKDDEEQIIDLVENAKDNFYI